MMPLMLRLAFVILALTTASCSSSSKRCPPPQATSASAATLSGDSPVEDANEVWLKIKTNAERAAKIEPGDPNRGWVDRAIEADGRVLFELLAKPEFDPYAVTRGDIRARLLFVIKPPTPEDRREAVVAIDRGFAEMTGRPTAR
jgi:hypothetical protein